MSNIEDQFQKFLNEPLSTEESTSSQPRYEEKKESKNNSGENNFWWIKDKKQLKEPIDVSLMQDELEKNGIVGSTTNLISDKNGEFSSGRTNISEKKDAFLIRKVPSNDDTLASDVSSSMAEFLEKEKMCKDLSNNGEDVPIPSPRVQDESYNVEYSDDFTDEDIGSLMEQLSQLAGSSDDMNGRSVEEILKEAEQLVEESSHSFRELSISSKDVPLSSKYEEKSLLSSHMRKSDSLDINKDRNSYGSESSMGHDTSNDDVGEISNLNSSSAAVDPGNILEHEVNIKNNTSISMSASISKATSLTNKESAFESRDLPIHEIQSHGVHTLNQIGGNKHSMKENQPLDNQKSSVHHGIIVDSSESATGLSRQLSNKHGNSKTKIFHAKSPGGGTLIVSDESSRPLIRHGNTLGTVDMIYRLIDEEVRSEITAAVNKSQDQNESVPLSKHCLLNVADPSQKGSFKVDEFHASELSNQPTDMNSNISLPGLTERLNNNCSKDLELDREPLSIVFEESSAASSIEGDKGLIDIKTGRSECHALEGGENENPLGQVDGINTRLAYVEAQLLQQEKAAQYLRVKLDNEETKHKKKMELVKCKYEEKLFELKKDIYVLNAKIIDYEKPTASADVRDEDGGCTSVQTALLEAELQHQEQLILGFQRENHKLCQLAKQLKEELKAKESQLSVEMLSLKETSVRNSSVEMNSLMETIRDRDETIVNLQLQLESLKVRNKDLEKSVTDLVTSITSLKSEVEKYKRLATSNRESNKLGSLSANSTILNREIQKYKAEIEKRDNEIRTLSHDLETAKDELSMKKNELLSIVAENNLKIESLELRFTEIHTDMNKERAQAKKALLQKEEDKKKIQDLNRQVKEMERILKRNHPNSISALILAANSESELASATPRLKYLENRVQQLEHEAELKEAEALDKVTHMQGNFQSIKVKYDTHVADLEHKVETLSEELQLLKQSSNRNSVIESSIQVQPSDVREKHSASTDSKETATNQNLHRPIIMKKTIQAPVITVPAHSVNALSVKEDAHLLATIRGLKLELTAKDRDIHKLSKELEEAKKSNRKLQLERERFLSREFSNTYPKTKGTRKDSSRRDKHMSMTVPRTQSYNDILPKSSGRTYDPSQFECHTEQEDVMAKLEEENKALKSELIKLEEEYKKLKTKRLQELNLLQEQHQAEMERLMSDNAARHSNSCIGDLQGQLCTQQLVISHLKEQLKQFGDCREENSMLKAERDHLEKSAMDLSKKLSTLRDLQTPEMRHFEELQDKIEELEHRHEFREQKLQSIVRDLLRRNAEQRVFLNDHQGDSESISMREKLIDKNRQLCLYRAEIDRILDTLREFNRQKGSPSQMQSQ